MQLQSALALRLSGQALKLQSIITSKNAQPNRGNRLNIAAIFGIAETNKQTNNNQSTPKMDQTNVKVNGQGTVTITLTLSEAWDLKTCCADSASYWHNLWQDAMDGKRKDLDAKACLALNKRARRFYETIDEAGVKYS